jgi:glycosyltransferase involved in cell wall biosynthesis
MEKSQPAICVITSPRGKAGVIPLSNLVDILHPLSHEIYVVTGGEGDALFKDHKEIHGYSLMYKAKTQLVARIFNYIYLQLRISYRLIKLARNVDIWIFFMGEGLLLPVLILKLLRKTVILSLAASAPKIVEAKKDIFILDRIARFLESINYILSNKIILYSENLIKEWNLERYEDKILIAHEHFIDFDKYKIKKRLDERNNLVGYIGRLSEEKGAINFVKAIPEILKERNDLEFLIGGDGQLRDKIERYLDEKDLNDKVKFTGWIPHEELPDYLNKLKLLVLPSYTEGLPNIMLEAMACGTPVLATPVGAIPDVIKDEETSFIMENNSPDCIARNIIRALNHPNLEKIAENGRKLMKKEFTYEAAIERYRGILENIRWRKND